MVMQQNWFFELLRTMAINPKNCLDNRWVSVPGSNNHPTLLDVTSLSWSHWHLSMKRKGILVMPSNYTTTYANYI
jgi:hypothetical protein